MRVVDVAGDFLAFRILVPNENDRLEWKEMENRTPDDWKLNIVKNIVHLKFRGVAERLKTMYSHFATSICFFPLRQGKQQWIFKILPQTR